MIDLLMDLVLILIGMGAGWIIAHIYAKCKPK